MKKNIFAALVILLVACAPFGDTPVFDKKTGGEIPFPGRGINLGNWLDAPRSPNWERSNWNLSSWGVRINASDYENIARNGFEHIRIPAKFSAYVTPEKRVEPLFMERLRQAVDRTVANGMVAIIDVHHFDEMNESPHEYFGVLKNIWEDIALEFKDYPDSAVLFELLNEPHSNLTIELWNAFSPILIDIIRKTNPTRPILLGTADWGGFATLKALKIPDDKNLIITLHYYNPSEFTHQGADWGNIPWNMRNIGTRWTGTPAQRLAMKQEFQEVADYARQKNLDVHIGEFGAFGKHAVMEDRALWTEYAVALCRHFGFSFAYWEYSAGFGAFDPIGGVWRKPLLDALMSDRDIDGDGYKISDVNLIRNPNFEFSAADWIFGVWDTSGAALMQPSPDGFVVEVSKVPAQIWQIQLIQSDLVLVAGKTYMLTFDVSGDEGTAFSVGVQTDVDWVNFGSANVSVPAQNVTAIINAQETQNSIRLVFSFGFSTGKSVISNVKLREIIF